MSDPTTTLGGLVGFNAGVLTVLGVVTGLQPLLIVAGLAGGWFSYYFMDELKLSRRFWGGVIAAMLAGWGAPFIAAVMTSFSWFPRAASLDILQALLALGIGFLTNPVIAPGSIQIARRRVEEQAK